jgi:hypothetical protein
MSLQYLPDHVQEASVALELAEREAPRFIARLVIAHHWQGKQHTHPNLRQSQKLPGKMGICVAGVRNSKDKTRLTPPRTPPPA